MHLLAHHNHLPPRIAALSALVAGLAVFTGCPLELDDDFGPQILNVTVDPSSIVHIEETLDDSQHFEITISTQDLDGEILGANVFIGDEQRYAAYDNMEVIDDNIVVLHGVAYTWFQGYDPGVYDIGAEVDSENGYIFELDQAAVTIEEQQGFDD